jgi:hypothetical protein
MKNTIITLLIIFFVSCSKDDDLQEKLPEATQTGANTAGCIVNGQFLIPKNTINTGYLGSSTIYGLETYAGPNFKSPDFNDFYSIKIANLKKRDGVSYIVYIKFNNLTSGIGDYIVGQSENDPFSICPANTQIIAQEFNDGIYKGKMFLSSHSSGLIKLTRFDSLNYIISGTFYCTLYNRNNPSETIAVKDGRFDIKRATLNK